MAFIKGSRLTVGCWTNRCTTRSIQLVSFKIVLFMSVNYKIVDMLQTERRGELKLELLISNSVYAVKFIDEADVCSTLMAAWSDLPSTHIQCGD